MYKILKVGSYPLNISSEKIYPYRVSYEDVHSLQQYPEIMKIIKFYCFLTRRDF